MRKRITSTTLICVIAAVLASVGIAWAFTNAGTLSFEKSTTRFTEISVSNEDESTSQTTDKTETTASKKTTSAAAESTSKKDNIRVIEKADTPAETTTKKKNKKKAKKPSKTDSEKVIYVTIDCNKALNNLDKISVEGKDELISHIPKSGYIIRDYRVPYSKNLTAYDAVMQTCSSNSIQIGAKDTQYGKYVFEINYIAEKDFTTGSGWIYHVNQKFPNCSLDKYKLNPGDRIIISYTI
ncbi:MAG: DUF4430 domain-containing protein [Eubacterium sp.]|nr:DUF4430 domain-containing protein [Eubacterium sp.]